MSEIMQNSNANKNRGLGNRLILPSALYDEYLARQLKVRQPVIFLDYDGTLTPLVKYPDRADLDDSVRSTLVTLAGYCPVSIVSGRDREHVESLVGIEGLIYAGSHGFDIRGPDFQDEYGSAFIPDLDDAEAELRRCLAGDELIERKPYLLTVHVGEIKPDDVSAVEASVDAVISRYTRLRKGKNKNVFDLLPHTDWNKGKAVLRILETLELPAADVFPVYIGDDRSDEYAFAVLAGHGAGILVGGPPSSTEARYSLNNPAEVHYFLEQVLSFASQRTQDSPVYPVNSRPAENS